MKSLRNKPKSMMRGCLKEVSVFFFSVCESQIFRGKIRRGLFRARAETNKEGTGESSSRRPLRPLFLHFRLFAPF